MPATISTRSSKPAKPTASNLTSIWRNCSASCLWQKLSKTSRHCYPGNSSSQKPHMLLRVCSNQSRGLKGVYGESAECQVFGRQIDIMTKSQRPIPDRRGRHLISIVKVIFVPIDCPVFGKQIEYKLWFYVRPMTFRHRIEAPF